VKHAPHKPLTSEEEWLKWTRRVAARALDCWQAKQKQEAAAAQARVMQPKR
jgi:hypothetical protein